MSTFTSPEERTSLNSAYEMILADTIARYRRISDYAVSFQNTTVTNLKNERALSVLRGFRSRFSISCDAPETPAEYESDVSPTMEKMRSVFHKLREKGDVYSGADGTWFLRLSAYSNDLTEHIKKNPSFIEPASSRKEMLILSRDALSDIPVSFTPNSIPEDTSSLHLKLADNAFAVPWFARLLCFLMDSGYDPGGQHSERYITLFPADLLLVKKADLPEYALYWSAVLLALSQPLPVRIFGFPEIALSDPGSAFSIDLVEGRYGVDSLRYYLLSLVSKEHSGNASPDGLAHLYRRDLSDLLSQLLHTTVIMCNDYFGGMVNTPAEPVSSEPDLVLDREAASMSARLRTCMDDLRVSDGLTVIFGLYHSLKSYMEETTPWLLSEDEANRCRLEEILYRLLDGIQTASSVVGAFLPETCDKILDQIHSPEITCYELIHTGNYRSGNRIAEHPEPIFPRVE